MPLWHVLMSIVRGRASAFESLKVWACPAPPLQAPANRHASGVNFFFAQTTSFSARIGNLMRIASLVLSLALAAATAPSCAAQTTPPKRPMTFEDMMHMKRLGDTAVSPDGKWLAYSVTTVNLEQNTKTAELWMQEIAGGEPQRVAVAQPGDSGLQFAPDGKRILLPQRPHRRAADLAGRLRQRHRRNRPPAQAQQSRPGHRQRHLVARWQVNRFHRAGLSGVPCNYAQ